MNSEKHLHPVAMLVGAVKTLRRWVSGLVFPGVVLLVSQGFSLWTVTLFLLGFIVVAALAALWGFLSWRATTYTVTGSSFRLRQGVFQRNERTIPLEHVQSVDTVQGIIQRAFGVYEVRIETAGGGASEPDASLAALDRDAGQTLRREIEGPERERSEETAGPTILRRLSTRELLVAGATSGQIGVAFSLLAIGFQFLDNFFPEDFIRRLVETLAPNWLMVVLILLPTGALLAWLLAIAGTVPPTLVSHSRARGTSCTSSAAFWSAAKRPYLSPAYRPSAFRKVSCASLSASPPCVWRAPAMARTRVSRQCSFLFCPATRLRSSWPVQPQSSPALQP